MIMAGNHSNVNELAFQFKLISVWQFSCHYLIRF